MVVLVDAPPRDIFVEKIGTDKAGPLVARGNPLFQVQRRQPEPAVIAAADILPDQVGHLVNIGRRPEVDVELLVAVFQVDAQDGELA